MIYVLCSILKNVAIHVVRSGPLIMQQLPPEVAARQAGRTLASAPNPDTWLVRLQHCEGTPWGHHEAGKAHEPGCWLLCMAQACWVMLGSCKEFHAACNSHRQLAAPHEGIHIM